LGNEATSCGGSCCRRARRWDPRGFGDGRTPGRDHDHNDDGSFVYDNYFVNDDDYYFVNDDDYYYVNNDHGCLVNNDDDRSSSGWRTPGRKPAGDGVRG
jgi:hypothetical protein